MDLNDIRILQELHWQAPWYENIAPGELQANDKIRPVNIFLENIATAKQTTPEETAEKAYAMSRNGSRVGGHNPSTQNA